MLGLGGDDDRFAPCERHGRNHGLVAHAVELLLLLFVRRAERTLLTWPRSSFQAAGLPRQAKTSENQTPCPFVHLFFPERRTRTGMLPRMFRSLRSRTTTTSKTIAMIQRGTPRTTKTAVVTLRRLPASTRGFTTYVEGSPG